MYNYRVHKARFSVSEELSSILQVTCSLDLSQLQCSPELLGHEGGREKSEALTQRVAALSDHLQQ